MSEARFVESLENRVLFAARAEGVDVSSFNGTMNFNTTYAQNKRFAWIRASRSDTLPDPNVATNVPAAKAAGLVVGVYHRALPFSNTADNGTFRDPIVDADSFIASGGAYMGTGYMRPVLDIENGYQLTTAANGYTLKTWVVAFINRIKTAKGVNPIVYCNSDYAYHYFDSTTVAASPDLWIARPFSGTIDLQTSQPQTPTPGYNNSYGAWNVPPTGAPTNSSWDFWQYSTSATGSTYGASSPAIDLDLYTGDINQLKQNFVIGATAIPSSPSPANAATNVNRVGLKLDWADTAGATRYDVYLDNNLTTPVASNLSASEWTISPQTVAGLHTWKVVAKPASNDDDTWVSSPDWTFTVASQGIPAIPSSPNPNNVVVTSKPVTLDWADSANATSYDVYLGTTPTPISTTVSQITGLNPTDGVRLWRVVAKNSETTTDGPQWSYTLDTTAPTATLGTQTPAAGNTFLDFAVTYTDATTSVKFSTLDNNDVTVTGPNGFTANATLQGVDFNTDGSPRIATYRILAPGGAWNLSDNGTYTVTQNASQVSDIGGIFRAAGTIGTFSANVDFAYKLGNVLHLEFDGSATAIAISESGGVYSAMRNAVTIPFTGVDSIIGDGTASADQLDVTGGIPIPLTFASGAGNDTMRIVGGTYTFDSDVVTTAPNLALDVRPGANAIFNTGQHLRSLNIDGTAKVNDNGAMVIVTKSLAIAGQFDLRDNDLVIDYTAVSPVGEWSNGDYTATSGMIRAGRSGGTWSGNGLVSTMPEALQLRTGVAVAEAAEVMSFSGSTALFGTETIDNTSVIVKYTYTGDGNLDGRVNADDFALIDLYSIAPASNLYWHGDFNYDGAINADDYAMIDLNSTNLGDLL